MLIADHLNLSFANPLVGPVQGAEIRFPHMSAPYHPRLRRLAWEVAQAERIELCEGVYAGVTGPSYETRAEIGMLRRLGADAVGMSTVGEVIVARAAGLACLGISVITNRAAGLGAGRLSHAEVVLAARDAGDRLIRLLAGIIARL
jgi:purine-nucleoside phosphorylase